MLLCNNMSWSEAEVMCEHLPGTLCSFGVEVGTCIAIDASVSNVPVTRQCESRPQCSMVSLYVWYYQQWVLGANISAKTITLL
jgi:hypothetical protein